MDPLNKIILNVAQAEHAMARQTRLSPQKLRVTKVLRQTVMPTKRRGLVVREHEEVTADFLRELTAEERLYAHLEMTWNRPENRDQWVAAAGAAERVFRGFLGRTVAKRRKKAHGRQRRALLRLDEARAVMDGEEREERELDTRVAAALALLDDAHRADPKCADAYVLRGEVLYLAGRFSEIVETLDTAFPVVDDRSLRDPRVELLMARVALLDGRWADAHDSLSAVLEREPSKPLDHYEKTPSLSAAASRQLLAAGSAVKEPSGKVDPALIATNEDNPRDTSALGVDDAFAHARFLRGLVAVKRHDFTGALRDFRAWAEAAPNLPKRPPQKQEALKNYTIDRRHRAKAFEYYGLALAANRQWNEAVDKLTDSLLLIQDARVMCALARVHCCEREWDLARDRYKDSLLIDPNLDMAVVGLEQATIQHEPLPWSYEPG